MPACCTRRRALATTAALGVVPALAACGGEPRQQAEDVESSASEQAQEVAGTTIAAADVPEGGGTILSDQKIVVTQPSTGEFHAFSAICTHQGCPVSEVTKTIDCTCHQSKFSLTDGSVVDGPAPSPLPKIPVKVDGDQLKLG